MLLSRATPDPLGGIWTLRQGAPTVPPWLMWDHESGVVRHKPTELVSVFAGALGLEIKLPSPRDPESNGMVERMNRFFRQRSCRAGRDFASPTDFKGPTQGLAAQSESPVLAVPPRLTGRADRFGPGGEAPASEYSLLREPPVVRVSTI